MVRLLRPPAVPAALLVLTACGADAGSGDGSSSGQRFPDVVDATVECSNEDCTADATISSPYDSPERYADAFRVSTTEGDVLGELELTHDHAGEQPFTRTLTDLSVPADVKEVVVEARDQANGWGGDTVTVPVQR